MVGIYDTPGLNITDLDDPLTQMLCQDVIKTEAYTNCCTAIQYWLQWVIMAALGDLDNLSYSAIIACFMYQE